MWTGRAIAATVIGACVVAGAAACRGDEPTPTASTTSTPPAVVATNGAPPAAGCRVPSMGTVDARSVLVPGPTNGVPRSTAGGEKLIIAAVVLDATCAPAAGASLNIWHTDARGSYGPDGADHCCYYGGSVLTDQNGRFRLETIRPGEYNEPNAPPAHIHLEIRHPSGDLESEIIFTDDPAPPVMVVSSRTVPVYLRSDRGASGASWYGEAAFVLER